MATTNSPVRVSRPTPSLAAAAGVAVAMLSAASAAHAQYRVGADGHYNDANNRAGSGGYNSPSDASYRSAVTGTQINTGDVSGLAGFQGNRGGVFDPNQLQLNTNDNAVQNFTRISAPVNYAQQSNGQSQYVPYYSQSQTQFTGPAATSNFTQTKNGVGYIPAPTVDPLTPSSDVRLQNLNNSPTDLATNGLPTPGSLDSAGPVNPVGNQSLYSMSPLYGLRTIQPTDATQDNTFVSRYGGGRAAAGPRMDPKTIQQMRAELQATTVDSTPGHDKGAELPGNGSGTDAANAGLGQSIRSDAVTGTSVPSASLTSAAAVNGQAVTGAVGQPISSQTETLLLAPGKQSAQLAELQKRFAANTPHPTAEQAANQLNRMRLAIAKQNADAAKNSGLNPALPAGGAASSGANPANKLGGGSKYGTAATPPSAAASAAGKGGSYVPPPLPKTSDLPSVVNPPAAAQPSDQPFVITSLTTGMRAKGLSDLLRTAEGQMRSGQFGQAVDTYDTAGEVAPNNPFVPLGRGFAELGASYYGKAEADLTRAVMAEPAVLAGQYDLKGFLGQDRLAFVEKDLAGIAASDQTARPSLLLAYIDHNTGKDDATITAKDLDEAARRGANPKLVDLMREAWNIKAPAAK